MSDTYAGGCQCGAIRYRFTAKPDGAHICHCRMCQKAVGNFFAPFVGASRHHFEVTRGTINLFRSSDRTERGFCSKCGTPLTFAYVDSNRISVTIGSLDHPELFPPRDQHGVESRLSWTSDLGHLPDQPSTETEDAEGAAAIAASNHQHPDHDTVRWPE
jgi:hypothetical protein